MRSDNRSQRQDGQTLVPESRSLEVDSRSVGPNGRSLGLDGQSLVPDSRPLRWTMGLPGWTWKGSLNIVTEVTPALVLIEHREAAVGCCDCCRLLTSTAPHNRSDRVNFS